MKHDKLLKELHKKKAIRGGKEAKKLIKDLEKEGLIRKTEGNYSLTQMGEDARKWGYRIPEKREEFEKKIMNYSPGKYRLYRFFLLFCFAGLGLALLLLVAQIGLLKQP